jgi:hypothetical protein
MSESNSFTPSDLDWAIAIKKWWDGARYLTSGSYGEHNVFDTEPEFVTKAKQVIGDWDAPAVSNIGLSGLKDLALDLMVWHVSEPMDKAEMQSYVRTFAKVEDNVEAALDVLDGFFDELLAVGDLHGLAKGDFEFRRITAKYGFTQLY